MDEGAKRRLIGAAVIVSLLVIFVPMLVEERGLAPVGEPIVIPARPSLDAAPDPALETSAARLNLPLPEAPAAAAPDADADSDLRPGPLTPPPVETPPAPDASPVSPTADSAAAPGPKPVPSGTLAWVVQIASLTTADAAQSLRDRLRQSGYPAFVEEATIDGARYYRVRVGPEIERATADELAATIGAATGYQPLVQRYP